MKNVIIACMPVSLLCLSMVAAQKAEAPKDPQPQAMMVVSKKPPDPLEEKRIDKPQGTSWIPGYWTWDPATENFRWVKGYWHEGARGKTWVTGSWKQVEDGWRWEPGSWVAEKPEARADDKNSKEEILTGDYTLIRGEKFGEQVPAEKIQGAQVSFKNGTIVARDKDKKQLFAATYTLNKSVKPWTISMTSTFPKQGEKAEGILEIEGDTVRLCYALEGERPKDFTTTGKQLSFVLRKDNAEK
jgi:uncharacterized protein (TIGR03067 family)